MRLIEGNIPVLEKARCRMNTGWNKRFKYIWVFEWKKNLNKLGLISEKFRKWRFSFHPKFFLNLKNDLISARRFFFFLLIFLFFFFFHLGLYSPNAWVYLKEPQLYFKVILKESITFNWPQFLQIIQRLEKTLFQPFSIILTRCLACFLITFENLRKLPIKDDC